MEENAGHTQVSPLRLHRVPKKSVGHPNDKADSSSPTAKIAVEQIYSGCGVAHSFGDSSGIRHSFSKKATKPGLSSVLPMYMGLSIAGIRLNHP